MRLYRCLEQYSEMMGCNTLTHLFKSWEEEASSSPGPLSQALSLQGGQSIRTISPGILEPCLPSAPLLYTCAQTNALLPVRRKSEGQNIKQNFTLQQVCFQNQERRFGKCLAVMLPEPWV